MLGIDFSKIGWPCFLGSIGIQVYGPRHQSCLLGPESTGSKHVVRPIIRNCNCSERCSRDKGYAVAVRRAEQAQERRHGPDRGVLPGIKSTLCCDSILPVFDRACKFLITYLPFGSRSR